MKVEELDLTKVADAFGGYIIEMVKVKVKKICGEIKIEIKHKEESPEGNNALS